MLYNCVECRNWHNGIDHVCGEPAPDMRDQRALEKAVVKAARRIDDEWKNGCLAYSEFNDLHLALRELDGLDRPLEDK